MTQPTNQTRWIVITPTICQGDVPAYWEEGDRKTDPRRPVTYPTEREAWKEVADTQIMKLQAFLDDEDLPDDEVPEFEPEDYICPCTIDTDGAITTEAHGVLYDPNNPKTWDF
jgi:hypothetical protein